MGKNDNYDKDGFVSGEGYDEDEGEVGIISAAGVVLGVGYIGVLKVLEAVFGGDKEKEE